MYFSAADIRKLYTAYEEIEGKYQSLLLAFAMRSFASKEAAEFAMHGFTRRVKTMKRCIENIYRICPPDIDRKPSSDELSDIAINLQAFVLNVYGALDNLAWVWVKEKGIVGKAGAPLTNREIGFAEKYRTVRDSFSPEFQAYLKTLDQWFAHVEEFRHALAHRIPLYVPPYASNEEEVKKERELDALRMAALKKHQFEEYKRLSDEIEALGTFVPWMTHSFGENSPQAVFHAQIIADWNTVMQVWEKFIEELNR
ncbi:MAG: hypothetical protein DI582_09790 [Azospirillum brasilense]|nr:MAG: hypothetical protein DI582_09790 [Azospirillum brasilense]